MKPNIIDRITPVRNAYAATRFSCDFTIYI